MSEESESTKDIRRAVCCQLAEALMHSNRYVFQIFRQITTLISRSAHRTPNFTNPEFQFPQFKVLPSGFFFKI